MASMNLQQAQSSLESHQTSFSTIVKQPNTLERNIVLAEHRAEIGRLQKLIAKSLEV